MPCTCLRRVESDGRLGQSLLAVKEELELSALAVLQHKVESLAVLHRGVQLEDERVVEREHGLLLGDHVGLLG